MKNKIRSVTSCDDCPGLWQNREYPESICRFANRSWGMGYHRTGDPIPDWCPLKDKNIIVKLKIKKMSKK